MGKRRTPINWAEYNKKLVARGKNLANALSSLKSYEFAEEPESINDNKKGHPFIYTNRFVFLLSILKSITGQSYRMINGIGYLFSDKVLSYSQLCRRLNAMPQETLESANRKITKAITRGRESIDVIFDGTGIMVNGTSVWIDEKTGTKRSREWKKLHITIDRETKAILFLEAIDKDKNEAENESMNNTMSQALQNVDDGTHIKRGFGDGLYGSNNNFEMFKECGIELVTRIREPAGNIAKSKLTGKIISEKSLSRFKANLRNRVAIDQIDWVKYVEEHEFGKRGGIEGVIGSFKRIFKEYAYSKKGNSIAREFLLKQITWNLMWL